MFTLAGLLILASGLLLMTVASIPPANRWIQRAAGEAMAGIGTPGASTSYRWVVIVLWHIQSVSGVMVLSTVGILLPAISLELDLSPSQQGILGSAAHWGPIVLAVPLGWWTSRFGAKALSFVTLCLATLFLFVQSWSPNFIVLLIARLAFGLTNIAQQPARAYLIQQWFQPREIIMVNGVTNVLFGLVVGGGLFVSPFILSGLGDDWRGTLRSFGGWFAVLTLLWLILGKERVTEEYQQRQKPRETGVVRGALGYRDLWVGGSGFMGSSMAFGAFLSFYPTLMLDTYQVSLAWSGSILALGVFVGGVAGLGIGYLAKATGKEKLILQALGLLMVGTYAGMVYTGSLPALMLLSIMNGVAWGFFPILITIPFHLPGIRPRETAVAMSFTMMNLSLGTAVGPLATGFLQEALGDLKPALLILSFAPLSLYLAGLILPFGTASPSLERVQPTPEA